MAEHVASRTVDGRAHRWSVALMCTFVAMVLVGAGTLIRQDRADARQALAERFQTRAELTASFTRDFVDDLAARELAQAERLLAAEVVPPQTFDHFKAINDTYGHDVGDEVIRATADLLADNVRGGDIAGRWGGEEFLVLLPHADQAAAQVVAERVRRAIEGMLPPAPAVSALQVTASVGVAATADGDLHELLLAADAALYAAKAAGRNRVAVSDPALSVV